MLSDDDLFGFVAAPPAPRTTARITCRVCEKPAEVALDAAGLLCAHCRADLDATQRHIDAVLSAALFRIQEVIEAFEVWLALQDFESQNRYAVLNLSRQSAYGPSPRVQRGIEQARLRGDGLSAILEREAERDRHLDAVSADIARIREWYDRAEMELEAARDAAK